MENKEKKEKRKKREFSLFEAKCPVCGKLFYPSPMWAWKMGDKKYCRYNCLRVEEKKKYEKRKRKIESELNR